MTLADLLEQQRDVIFERWLELVRPLAPRPDLAREELLDSLPDLLRALARSLRAPDVPARFAAVPACSDVAEAHGEQRRKLGYSTGAVASEYPFLHEVTLRVALHHGVEVSPQEGVILARCLGAASAAALAQPGERLGLSSRGTERLGESETWLRLVVDSIPSLIAFVDSNQRYLLGNDAYLEWFGVRPGTLRGRTVREVVGEANYAELLPHIQRVLAGEVVHYCEPLRRVAGRRTAAEGIFVPHRSSDGRVVGYVVLVHDVTERSQLAAQREALLVREQSARETAERLAREEARLREYEQQLLGIVSHDLRNPLGAILVGTQLLEREGLGERQAAGVARIRRSAERAVRLVHDLLDFTQARLGATGIQVTRTRSDFHALVRGMAEELEAIHPERQIRLSSKGSGEGEWDSDRLAQAIGNLLSNALKYSPPETAVDVEAVGEDGAVTLRIHNGGEPIPREQLSRVFEPLHRATAGSDQRERSVGLGLFIVQHIVQAHGGTVEVRSTSEEGTTFTVRLPREA